MHQELQVGLQHHHSGQLRQAAEIYEALLRREPQHADAIHLLGVVALQQGNLPRAVELISRAIAVNPSVSSYHCNLGEAYRLSGQQQRATGSFRMALAVDPQCADAANGLGLVLAAQGQPVEAAEQYRVAIKLNPAFALAHVNLGNSCFQQGNREEAVALFRRAVELAPHLGLAHCNLGQLLLEEKRVDEALLHCREAVRLEPNLAEAHNNLGNVLRFMGRLTEAKVCYTEALRLNPELAMVYNNLGQALQEEGRLDDAIVWYQQALARDPSSARFHINHANALQELERHEEALAQYQTALRLHANHAETHLGLGRVHHDLGQFDEAVACIRHALELEPGLAEAHFSLGNLEQELGNFEAAEVSFREALRHDAKHAAALAALASLLRGRLPEADLGSMQQCLAAPFLGEPGRCVLHLGLAQVLDDRGQYAEAADHVAKGKALDFANRQRRGRAYNPAAHSRFVDRLLTIFSADFFARARQWGLESEVPVFIFGLPRSGTTLLEQILASHSQVHGGGELSFARADFEAIAKSLGQRHKYDLEIDGLSALEHLDPDLVRQLARHHLEKLQALRPSAMRVVDKMPDNYLFLGLLATLFPRAKFIHCRRDLRDVAVSCWITHFRQINWASDPAHIAARFREYRRLMDHWEHVLPLRLLEVDYEEAVADVEKIARRMVAWCGLEWEPSCLRFYETARPVRTASVTQVRRPIYNRSVGRWKNYIGPLEELFVLLNRDVPL